MATWANETSPPSSGRKPLLRQMRAVSRMKSVSESSESSPVKEEGKKAEGDDKGETSGGASGDGVQRNLSLEALFQVTHSELKNISRKEDDPAVQGDGSVKSEQHKSTESSVVPVTHVLSTAAKSEDGQSENPPVLVQLQVVEPVPEGQTVGNERENTLSGNEVVILRSQDEGEMIVDDSSVNNIRVGTPQQLQICVDVASTPPEALVEVEMSEASSEGKQTVVKLPVSKKGIEKYQLKSDSLEEQGLKLTYTKKTYDQYEPNPISYGAYKPRSYKPTSHSLDASAESGQQPQVGRKRKHPAKPGRHICPYCSRGCAKPSVLQKHIRAHTGERPFPCVPCGFSFKTKSNLYKHCKSRAHAIKAGLSPSVDDSSRDPNKSREESFCEEEMESDDISEGEDSRMSDSSMRDGSSRSTSVETADNPQSAASSFDSVRSKSKDEHYVLQNADTGEIIIDSSGKTDGSVQNIGSTMVITSSSGSPQIVRASRVYKTDKHYFDIKQTDLKTSAVLPSSPSISNTVISKAPVIKPALDVMSVTSVVEKESDNSMKVTIKYPKVTKQQAISFDQNIKMTKSLSVGNLNTGGYWRSSSLPDPAQAKLGLPLPGTSVSKDSKVVTAEAVRDRLLQLPGVPPKASIDHKNMTPDMIGERISQLISNNAAVLDMPMADAPRPKRMSRQNSEVKNETPTTQRSILSPSLSLDAASNRYIFQGHGRAKSMDVKIGSDSTGKTLSSAQSQESHGSFLSQAEPTDQPPGSVTDTSESQMMAELVAAAKTATPVPATSLTNTVPSTTLPQEFKIQIKLPKAATTDASSVQAAGTPSSNLSAMVLPDGNQSYIGQPGVLLPNASGMLVRQLSLPIKQQQGADSSVIRELLLKGHAEQKIQQQQADPAANTAPPSIQMFEIRPDGSTSVINDFTPVVVVDGKGTTTTTYMTPVTQDPVPMNVAQDVEVIATSDGLQVSPRAHLKRAMSLPQGLPTASGSASPYGNVIFDRYDPNVQPKRGRPKGSKNRVREQLSLNIPSAMAEKPNMGTSPAIFTSTLQMPLLNAAPTFTNSPVIAPARPSLRLTIPQPSVTPSAGIMGTPVLNSTPGTGSSYTDTPPTAQSLTKLKLKGKLLMKRSMSVERMLSQERDKMASIDESLPGTPIQGISSPALLPRASSMLLTPTSNITNPLLRTASADEATPLKKRRAAFMSARSDDSPIRRLLNHSADSAHHTFAATTEVSTIDLTGTTTMTIPAVTPARVALSFDSQERSEKLLRIPSLNRQDSVPIPVKIQPKLSPLSVMVSTPPTIVVSRGTAPTNQYQPFNFHQQPFVAPLLQLSRPEKLQLPQSLFLSLKLSPNATNLIVRTPSDEKDTSKGSLDGLERSHSSEASMSPIESAKDVILKRQVELENKLSSSEGGSMDSMSSTSSGRTLTEKGVVQVLLLGHKCPTLRMLTHTTFCTLAKPQPMYVPQETSKQLSMYSNWRSARFNPNPVGLSSRDLMSLHHLRTYDNDPFFTSPTMGPSKTGVLTHSSYWNYYNKMKAQQHSEEDKAGEEDVRIIKQVPEVKMATGVRIAEEEEKVFLHTTAPNVAMETVVVTTPALPKQKSKEPKRCKIFAGGYKTNEEYIYIRGRGRGKYVCEECGIRCKKPSMLRKHIRTHTDVRPYLCKHCSFSFKTKGNLTKHMKSKAHQKKCIELGIVPVPVMVDDSQIDPEALALQAQMAKEGRVPSEDDDGQFSDGEDEDEEEEEEEEEDDGHETMMVVDAITGEVKDTIRCQVVRKDAEGPHYVAIQEGDSGQPTLVKIDAKTQAVLVQQARANDKQRSLKSIDGEVVGQDDADNDQPRPSIDKEIAHSLLDLSKGNEPKKSKGAISLETRRLLRQHSSHAAEEKEKEKEKESVKDQEDPDGKADGTRLDSLIGALMSRTKGSGDSSTSKAESTVEVGHLSAPMSMVRMATTIYQSALPSVIRGQPSTSDLQHIHRRSHNTYAQKIAALQSANENDLRMTLSRSRVNATGSGFVPPIFVIEAEEMQRKSMATGATPAKNMLRRQASVGGLSESASEDHASVVEPQPKAGSEDRPVNLSIDKETDSVESAETSVASNNNTQTMVSNSVQSNQGEANAPPENIQTPVQVPDTPPIFKDGKYTCPFCEKVFSEFSQYAYHKNIHYIERTYRCDECSLAFRTMAHLKKHMRSEVHQNKQNVNQQYGTPSSENPRPFKCDDCNIAFRIYGHLAKHNRSKSHIVTLEKLGKAMPETTAPDSDIEVLEEEGVSVDAEEDTEVAHASLKSSSIDNALKDPENLLQPRETTPVPQELSTSTANPTAMASQQRDSPGSAQEGLEADQFRYHKLSDYEKDFNASNEKVTVEKIKMEPIDIGTFSSLGSRTEGEAERFAGSESDAAERVARNREVFRHQAGSGSGEQHPHKCGICGRTFKAISTLKQHLVTHAELRPYVCEYCDAGFTTAQSLKFHLRTHTQERPYICGQCGDTFAGSEHLRQHMHMHEDGVEEQNFPPSPKPTEPPGIEPVSVEAVNDAGSPVVLAAAPTYQNIKPRPSIVQTLKPSQGQLLRSASADQHMVRDIRPKGSEPPMLASEVSSATRRRMAFTSSLSLPIQSGAVQLVPMIQGNQSGDQLQLLQQPLSVVRMPMISLPVQNANNATGFGGQLQTVLAPSTTIQTLLLQSPMVLQSMPFLQQVPPPTQPTSAVSMPIMTTPTITITTPTRVTMKAEDHEDIVVCSQTPSNEPAMIPTVVVEKEEEDGSKISQSQATTIATSQELPLMVSTEGQSVTTKPKICTVTQSITNLPHMMTGPVITVTPPDGKTVTEHVPTPMLTTAPTVSMVTNPLPAELPGGPNNIELSQSSLKQELPQPVISNTGLTLLQNDIESKEHKPQVEIQKSHEETVIPTEVSHQPSPMQTVRRHEEAVTTTGPPLAKGPLTGSQKLATKLIPGNDKAQEELICALEQQGLSPDTVKVIQVKGENDEHTQYVIIECQGNEDLDDHAIAELISQNKASTTGQQQQEVREEMSVSSQPSGTEITEGNNTVTNASAVTDSDNAEVAATVSAGEPESSSEKDTLLKEAAGVYANARQRGILKRQHSIDLADHSAGGGRNVTANQHPRDPATEPPSKVIVTENSQGGCIPQAVIDMDTKDQS